MSSRHRSDGWAAPTDGVVIRGLRRAARRALRIVFTFRVRGMELLPAAGPALLVGNHSGFLDGPIIYVELPRPSAFLVKSELYVGALRPALDRLHQIPVRRGRPDRTALRRGLGVLEAGGLLGVFPEGTRGSGSLETIQHGVGYLALKAACPVVPVVCLGTHEALPKGSSVPRWRTPVDVVFGDPFHVQVEGDPRSRHAVAQAAEQIRARLRDHLAASLALTDRPPLPQPAAGELDLRPSVGGSG